MKRLNTLLVMLAFTGSVIAQTTWTADKVHSKVGFNATHMVVAEVEGLFKDFDVKVAAKSPDFNGAEVEFTAKVASINTDNEKRDNHLKSDDFFSAEKFPEIKFKGSLVKEGDKYKLKGDLTIRDVTKAVVFDVTYGGSTKTFGGKEKAGFKVSGKIDRFEYGLKWDKTIEAGGLIVGKEIEIVAKVELDKQA